MTSSLTNNGDCRSNEPLSIHSASIDEIYNIPMKDIIRPLPSVLDENKVQSLMETIQTMKTNQIPPIDVLWYEASKSGNNYFFAMGGCHRWEAHKRLNSATIRAKLVRTTLNDLKVYFDMNEEKFHRDPEEYAIFKRLNNKQFSKRQNDIYVTRKTNFKAQLERCIKLISSNGNYREIVIYGMGSALQRTINLALQFQLKTNCQLHTTIASIEVTDHLMPLLDDLEPMSDTRWVSTICITCTLPTILTEMSNERRISWQKLASFFQSSNRLRRYQLYSNEDYLQLPVEVISPLSNNTVACESGPDVGLVDIARHQKKGILKVNNSIRVAGQLNWQMPNEQFACGLSTSLYDRNPFTGEVNGEPIADCFAICAQENNAILMIADGVNWGYKARLAARCAIHGAMASLNKQLYEKKLNTTKDIFERITAAIEAAQQLIFKSEGSLTTLTISIVCPSNRRWLVCSASVGDSNAYVYSRKQKSVFELTEGSRDLNNERNMCSPGGALGTTMDEKADLSNLAYSLMEIEQGDFVFLTTDGISDNYDPCVSGAAASVKTPLLSRKSTNSSSQIPPTLMTAYERHLCSLQRMNVSIADNDEQLNALDLCNRLLQYTIRLTEELRQIIETGVRENEGIEGSARKQFEMEMRNKVGKIPGKLDHASIVAYQVK